MMQREQASLVFLGFALLVTGGCGDGASPEPEAPPMVRRGQAVFEATGCAACHTLDGRSGIGPTLKDVYGTSRPLSDGSSIFADENYLRHSTLDHGAQLVRGYPNAGPSMQGQLTVEELDALVELLKYNSRHTTTDEDATGAGDVLEPPAAEPG